LTACGITQTDSPQAKDSLPVATQLALGTLKLDGTEQAVTSEQANELLVMWQVYQELTSSYTAAQEEIDDLVDQIGETMTAEQKESISAMNLNQQDIFAIMQEQGVGMVQVRQNNGNGSSTQSGGGFVPPDGGMAGGPPDAGMASGAPPDGGMTGLDDAEPGVSTGQSQAPAAGPGLGGSAGVPTVLVEALIQLLEQRARI